MSKFNAPKWLEDYHRCTGRRRTGRTCVYRGVVKIGKRWYCRRHAKKKEEESTELNISVFQRTLNLHNKNELPPDTDYKRLWEKMVPPLIQEVRRLRELLS